METETWPKAAESPLTMKSFSYKIALLVSKMSVKSSTPGIPLMENYYFFKKKIAIFPILFFYG